MISVRTNNLSLKYQRCKSTGFKDKEKIRVFGKYSILLLCTKFSKVQNLVETLFHCRSKTLEKRKKSYNSAT